MWANPTRQALKAPRPAVPHSGLLFHTSYTRADVASSLASANDPRRCGFGAVAGAARPQTQHLRPARVLAPSGWVFWPRPATLDAARHFCRVAHERRPSKFSPASAGRDGHPAYGGGARLGGCELGLRLRRLTAPSGCPLRGLEREGGARRRVRQKPTRLHDSSRRASLCKVFGGRRLMSLPKAGADQTAEGV